LVKKSKSDEEIKNDKPLEQDNIYDSSSRPPSFKISKPMIAGVLLIVAGILSFALMVQFISVDVSDIDDLKEKDATFKELNKNYSSEQIRNSYLLCGTIGCIIAVFSILGGMFAIKKKMWVIALTGGVFGVFMIFQIPIVGILSIIAVILLLMSRKEFQKIKKQEIDNKID